MIRPRRCCAVGSYDCAVPMAIDGRRRDVDFCIADIIAALNAANLTTVASCCGHGDESRSVITLKDGRELRVSGHTPRDNSHGG